MVGRLRYLSIRPKRDDVIETIELVKPDHHTAPLVVAMTLEVPGIARRWRSSRRQTDLFSKDLKREDTYEEHSVYVDQSVVVRRVHDRSFCC
jgi:hypothetical protein